MKRLFDVVASLVVLILTLPFFVLIALAIVLDSRGGVFYRQSRMGKNMQPFGMLKFRTMVTGAEQAGKLTLGGADNRITRVGGFLRKYKLDEFPQLINILKGEMSVVGPRPETLNYVALWTPEQQQVLTVLPGLTDFASLAYVDEGELLAAADDPERLYTEEIMPAKIAMNLQYIQEKSMATDLKIIFRTIGKIVSR